jgi:hypothetical protein
VLFSGSYNHQGEILRLWTHATGPDKAHQDFICQLEKILKRNKGYLRRYFAGDKDNFKIREERRINSKNGLDILL